MTIEELVRRFRDAAIEKSGLAEPAARDHALHEAMSVAWRQLHELGAEGRAAFSALLADESRHVRGWVAAQLLALGDESVLSVLLHGVAAMSDIPELRLIRENLEPAA